MSPFMLTCRNVDEEYWNRVLRPGAFPGVNLMRGMQYQIILNMTLCPKLICTIPTPNNIKSQNATVQLIPIIQNQVSS